jgi:hypothetical protein
MPDRSRRGRSDAAPRPAPGEEVTNAQSESVAKRPGKDPSAVALGRKGGLKGGKARAAKLTPERRSEIARKAATARWDRTT